MRNILFAIFMAFMLAACGTTQPNQVTKTEVRYEKIPKHLTEQAKVDKPKAKVEYQALKPHEKEDYLTEYVNYLLGVIKQQNIKFEKIDKLNGQLK